MKKIVLACFFLLAVFRFTNLGEIPIFIDEQTYLSLGANIVKNPHEPFLSLKYLVFPVIPWTLAVFQLLLRPLFNPLLLGRSIMVVADLLSAFLIYLIAKKILGQRYAFFSCLIYLTIPLNFFHSRLVLLEPITNMFFLAGFYYYLEIISFQKKTKFINLVTKSLFSAILISLSFLSKPLAIVSFSAMPFAAVSFWYFDKKVSFKKLLIYLIPYIFMLMFIFLLTLPFIINVWSGYSDYRVSPNIDYMFAHLKKNIWLVWWWSKSYVSYPFILACAASFILAVFSKQWKIIWVFLWLAAIIFLESLVGANFLPRHLFLISAPIALVIGFFVSEMWKRLGSSKGVLLILVILFLPLSYDVQIIYNPKNAPIALEDKQQFFEDWTSGEGLNLVASDLKALSSNDNVVVLTEIDGGFAWALENVYDSGNAKILELEEIAPTNEGLKLPQYLKGSYSNTYVILNRNTEPLATWPIELVSSHPKASSVRYIKIYKYQWN